MLNNVDTATMHKWIDDAMVLYTNDHETFTAYTITLQLRADHPDDNIEHGVVQARVHYLMGGPYLDTPLLQTKHPEYVMQGQLWQGNWATTYIWVFGDPATVVSVQAQPVTITAPTAVPLIPGTVKIDWGDDDDFGV